MAKLEYDKISCDPARDSRGNLLSPDPEWLRDMLYTLKEIGRLPPGHGVTAERVDVVYGAGKSKKSQPVYVARFGHVSCAFEHKVAAETWVMQQLANWAVVNRYETLIGSIAHQLSIARANIVQAQAWIEKGPRDVGLTQAPWPSRLPSMVRGLVTQLNTILKDLGSR